MSLTEDGTMPGNPLGDGEWRRNRGTKVTLDIPEPKRVSPMDLDRDRRKVERAMRKRQREMGGDNPTRPEITNYDRTLFGRPVRIEVDVCIGIDDLRTLLNGIRADLTNAILHLERSGDPSDRRHAAHMQLSRARARSYALRQDLLTRGKVPPSQ